LIARLLYLSIVVAGGWMLGIGMYVQYALGLKTCAPAVLERYAFVFAAVFAAFAILVNAGKIIRWTITVLVSLVSLAGATLAAHQSWPGRVPGPARLGLDADRLAHSLPLADVLPRFFLGSGECAKAHWRILGLTTPEWSVVFFVLFVVVAILAARQD